MTFLPILAAAGVWLLRRSVVSELVAETKQQLEIEVKTQLEKEVAAEVKKQTEDFKQELEILKSDFLGQLSQLNNLFLDAQNQKEQILQQLSGLTPSPSLTIKLRGDQHRELAKTNSDFDLIRVDERFKKILAG